MRKILFVMMLSIFSLGLFNFNVNTVQAAEVSVAQQNKQLVETVWNAIFNQHDVSVIDTFVADEYKQHNPGFKTGKSAFKTAISGYLDEFPESTATIKQIVAEGDLVFIHNHIQLNPEDRGQAAVDIFRVKDGMIVEHWDVIQDIPEASENDNTMF